MDSLWLQRVLGTANQSSSRRRYAFPMGYRSGTASVSQVERLEDRTLLAAITVPTGIASGDSYRLAFVTSTKRDATSGDIADYNAFVTAAANSQSELSGLGTTWAAIITLEQHDPESNLDDVTARDNTGTNPTVDTGVPIFLLNDTKLADDNADLWDGSVDVPFNVNEAGDTVTPRDVWTGAAKTGWGACLVAFSVFRHQALVGRIAQTAAGLKTTGDFPATPWPSMQ